MAGPAILFILLNILVLALWTGLSPLRWERFLVGNVDKFNRDLESVGMCLTAEANGWAPYVWTLLSMNLAMVLVANYQAYRSRKMSIEFSESQHVAMIMAALLQAILIGIPLLAMVASDPVSFFIVKSLLVFVVCMVVLICMFVPKMLHLGDAREEARKKAKRIAQSRMRDEEFQRRCLESEQTCLESEQTVDKSLVVIHPKVQQEKLDALQEALDKANDRESLLRQRIALLGEGSTDNDEPEELRQRIALLEEGSTDNDEPQEGKDHTGESE